MIHTERGKVIVSGNVHETYADLMCIFRAIIQKETHKDFVEMLISDIVRELTNLDGDLYVSDEELESRAKARNKELLDELLDKLLDEQYDQEG